MMTHYEKINKIELINILNQKDLRIRELEKELRRKSDLLCRYRQILTRIKSNIKKITRNYNDLMRVDNEEFVKLDE